MAAPKFFTLNAATIAGGDKSAAVQDTANILHQLVLAEFQIPGNDPTIVGPATPLPTQAYGVYNASLPGLTDGNISGIQLDSSGRVLVNLSAGGVAAPADNGSLFTIGTTPGLPGMCVVGTGAANPTLGNLAIPCMTCLLY